MPFKKGYKRSPGAGMKKGQKTAKVQAWEELGEYIIGAGAEKYLEYITRLKAEDFARRYETMLEFFKPKMQRGENKTDLNVNVIEMPQIIIKRD